MAEQNELAALTAQPKAFTVPPAPELAALKGQIGGVPGAPSVPDYAAQRAKIKTSKDASAEEARALQRSTELGQEIGMAQQAEKEYLAGAKADIASQERQAAQQIEANLDATRAKFPYPEFHPTKENMQDIATMFSLIGVIGMAMGGGGKMSAMNSLNSMSGMMKGWQQGRADLFKREKEEFDKNMASVKAKLEDAYKDADRAYKALAYNRQEAEALAGQSAAKLGGQVAKQILEKQGIENYFKYIDGVKRDLQHVEALEARHKEHQAQIASNERIRLAQIANTQELKRLALAKKDTDKILPMTQGVRSIESLMTQLADPEVRTGLIAKTAPLIEKLTSLSGAEFEAAVNQSLTGTDKTTLFLKDALLETYAIERAAKGGQRLTVQDMKMVGPVLDPTNYKPETYMELLNQRRKFLYNNLQDLGYTTEDIKKLSAQRPYESFSGGGVKNFSSVEEAEKANLPKGTRITINGRSATVE